MNIGIIGYDSMGKMLLDRFIDSVITSMLRTEHRRN